MMAKFSLQTLQCAPRDRRVDTSHRFWMESQRCEDVVDLPLVTASQLFERIILLPPKERCVLDVRPLDVSS